jgi:acetyl-CoA acetyltransferase
VRDVAIIAFAQSALVPEVEVTETQMLYPVVNQAIETSGIERAELGFTCSGSADYLAGAPFAFVSNLEATGAWPPISESHVEMDGAWALYEAWVRLQHGDIDTALVFSSGVPSRGDLREILCLQHDPYSLMPLWVDHVSMAALSARAVLDAGHKEEELAAIAARSREAGAANPVRTPNDNAARATRDTVQPTLQLSGS